MNFVLLTFEQVAEASGLRSKGGIRTVRKWASSGHLPVVRLPSGAVRVDSRDYEKFIMEHKTPAIAAPDPNSLLASLGLPKRSRPWASTTSHSTEPTPPRAASGQKKVRGAG